jgi:hypothetical protein
MPKSIFAKIISGGQTGVERAALDIALEKGIPSGGWCLKGRIAEDGRIDSRYPLRETKSNYLWERTERNVNMSDGTLILTWGPPTGGTALTLKLARDYKKPYIVIDLREDGAFANVRQWAKIHQIQVLNVAGPKEGKFPGIYEEAKKYLEAILVNRD